MRVAYRDDPAIGIKVNLIRSWVRGEIERPTMSTSSGPKDYTCNHIFSIFERCPSAARVLMVRGEYSQIGEDKHPSLPFLLIANDAGQFFDMAQREVLLES